MLWTEQAFKENSYDPNILLALNPTLASGYAHQALSRKTSNRPNLLRRDHAPHTLSLQVNSIAGPSSSRRDTHSNSKCSTSNRRLSNHVGGRPNSSSKSTEHLRKLCELNKCFKCETTGHMAKDCPRHHSLPHCPRSGINGL